jgi:LAS superfamily LD-carboxypeptidase LdcB
MPYSKVNRSFLLIGFSLCLSGANIVGAGEVYGKSRARSHKREGISMLQPRARIKLNAALGEMHRRGIRPRLTSTFRTTAEQGSLYRCARNRRCRQRRGIYSARRPGTSLHEAGLAVDIGGVAITKGGRRRLTPKGRRVVRIMRKHGFVWRYGLKDPAHFELSPRRAGYRSKQAAIKAGQRRASATLKGRARKSRGRG